MKSPDIKKILLKQLDEYTKYHAEKYAEYVRDELMDYITLDEFEITLKDYDEWKNSDCCQSSCGCESITAENLFKDEEALIFEMNPDTGDIRSRVKGDYENTKLYKSKDEWIIDQYNRNRLAEDQITNINQIPKDAGKK